MGERRRGSLDDRDLFDPETARELRGQDRGALHVGVAVDRRDHLDRDVRVGVRQGESEAVVDVRAGGAHGEIGVQDDAHHRRAPSFSSCCAVVNTSRLHGVTMRGDRSCARNSVRPLGHAATVSPEPPERTPMSSRTAIPANRVGDDPGRHLRRCTARRDRRHRPASRRHAEQRPRDRRAGPTDPGAVRRDVRHDVLPPGPGRLDQAGHAGDRERSRPVERGLSTAPPSPSAGSSRVSAPRCARRP